MASETQTAGDKQREFFFSDETDFAPVARSEIIGIDHILKELDHYVEYLKHFEEAQNYGVELNAGILFKGEPGTGKTLCARYIATESNSRFINVQDFFSHFSEADKKAGKHIAKLFKLAREYVAQENRPVVLFFDEFESYLDSESIVQSLKQELSGIKGKARGVFLVATTNHPSHIDDSLLRDGRIGESIYFAPPNREAKRKLLKYYVSRRKNKDVDYESLSFLIDKAAVPSTIEEVVNKAWRTVCMRAIASNKEPSLTSDILLKVLLEELEGVPENTQLTEDQYRSIAVHEVGHALVARTIGHPLQLIALARVGYSDASRIEDFDKPPFLDLDFYSERIAVLLSGIEALKICGIPRNNVVAKEFDLSTLLASQVIEGFQAEFDEAYKVKNDFTGISTQGLTKSRESIGMPPTMGMLTKTGQDNLKQIEALLKWCRERAIRILGHYQNLGVIDKLVKQLHDNQYLLQKDIDQYVVPEDDIAAAPFSANGHAVTSDPVSPGQYL